jgi:murein DD-endopeptidase MepM/ murein hydrolase activator NlpD
VDRVTVLLLRGRGVKRRLTILALVNIAVVLLGCVPAVLTSGSSTSPRTGGGVGTGGGTTGPVGWPTVAEAVITRGYGCHQFFTGVHGPCGSLWWHDGVDFALASGPPLYAVTDMRIDYAGVDNSSLDCSHIAGSQPPHTGFGIYVKGVDNWSEPQ